MIVKEIFQIIKRINKTGTTVLLVEQNAHLAIATAHYGYVMEMGEITCHGSTAILKDNPAVKEAYLGA